MVVLQSKKDMKWLMSFHYICQRATPFKDVAHLAGSLIADQA